MTSIQPQVWVERGASAVAFYQSAFGAVVLHQVGEGEDIVAQLAVDGAAFWVATVGSTPGRFSPTSIGGTTGRTLLEVDDPESMMSRTIHAGATEQAPVADEHGWRLGRLLDPFGHEWEISRPLTRWPPD